MGLTVRVASHVPRRLPTVGGLSVTTTQKACMKKPSAKGVSATTASASSRVLSARTRGGVYCMTHATPPRRRWVPPARPTPTPRPARTDADSPGPPRRDPARPGASLFPDARPPAGSMQHRRRPRGRSKCATLRHATFAGRCRAWGGNGPILGRVQSRWFPRDFEAEPGFRASSAAQGIGETTISTYAGAPPESTGKALVCDQVLPPMVSVART